MKATLFSVALHKSLKVTVFYAWSSKLDFDQDFLTKSLIFSLNDAGELHTAIKPIYCESILKCESL